MMTKKRAEAELKVLRKELPDNIYRFLDMDTDHPYLAIAAKTNNGNVYTLKIELADFPESVPRVFVNYMLYDANNHPLNIPNSSMHTLRSENGCTQICHVRIFGAVVLAVVFLKMLLSERRDCLGVAARVASVAVVGEQCVPNLAEYVAHWVAVIAFHLVVHHAGVAEGIVGVLCLDAPAFLTEDSLVGVYQWVEHCVEVNVHQVEIILVADARHREHRKLLAGHRVEESGQRAFQELVEGAFDRVFPAAVEH